MQIRCCILLLASLPGLWHYSEIPTMNESSNSKNESDELFQAANNIQNNPENEKRSEISPEGKADKARTLLYFE